MSQSNNVIHIESRRASVVSETRTVIFTLSKTSADRANDVVHQDGWKLASYMNNPVILWGHNHSIPAIGRMGRMHVEGDALVGAVTFATAEQHPFADTVYRLVEGGFLNAGSVGFIPHRYEIRADGGLDFLENELIEYSIVNIPMHPEALARAVAGGIDIAPLAKSAGALNAGSYSELRAKLLASNTPPLPHPSSLAMLRNSVANRDLRTRIR